MKRSLLVVAAAACGAGAVLAAVGSVSHRSAVVGRNVFVNPAEAVEANVVDALNTPTVARDPRHPDTIVVTHRVDRPAFTAFLERSVNGGRTWHQVALPLPAGLDRPYAPDAAFGPDGTLYVLYANLTGRGNNPDNLWLSRSPDGGRTLGAPMRITGALGFQARIAIGPRGVVYVTWLQASEVGRLRLAGAPAPVVASKSTDGGATWSAPVQVSDPARVRVGAASPVVDSRGRLVVLYEDFKNDARDFEFLDGPAWDSPFTLVVTASDNGAQSFSAGVEVDADVLPTRRFLVFLPEFPSLAAGADGELYVAWADGRDGDEDVFLRRSPDGGNTWSPATRVNDNPRNDGTSQYLPRLAVAPNGRLDALYYDRRRDPSNVMTDVWLASSSDGGRSFEGRRVSTGSFDSFIGSSADPTLPVDFGSRLGLSSSDNSVFGAWTDTRFGTIDTGRQDIVGVAVEWRREPSVPLLLGAAGLVVMGAVFFAWWMVTAPPPVAQPAREEEPVDEPGSRAEDVLDVSPAPESQ